MTDSEYPIGPSGRFEDHVISEEEAAEHLATWRAFVEAELIAPLTLIAVNWKPRPRSYEPDPDPDANIEHHTRAQGYVPGGVGRGMDPGLFGGWTLR